MMTGRLYIDGHDAYRQWGVYVVSGGWNEVLSYPPLKTPEANDWQEEDGIEADLTYPKLNISEPSIKFAYSGIYGNFLAFIEFLSDGAYHNFNCASIGRSFTLRMMQTPNLDMLHAFGFITIKFCNDFTLCGYTYQPPASRIMRVEDYLIDGFPFTDYGCRILQGSLAEVIKTPAVKQNLLRNIASQPGAIYDGHRVTFKTKDVKLNCLMRAETLDELWRNYDALLFDLIRPDERLLEISELGQGIKCFYKCSSVTAFYPIGKIWLEFSLTLTFTNPHPVIIDNILLHEDFSLLEVDTPQGETLIRVIPLRGISLVACESGEFITIDSNNTTTLYLND